MLTLSKYNVFSKVADSPNYFIVNLLSGNADILTPEKAAEIINNRFTDVEEYIARGYLVDEAEEAKQYKLKYLDFLQKRDKDEIQIFFVPRYNCNFSCAYCYQSEYTVQATPLTKEVVDAFYHYVNATFAGRRTYITIFGGEPLMNSSSARVQMKWLLEGANTAKLDVAVVTNGYYLSDYLDLLTEASIREIQVTLDGTAEIHNKRRYLIGGGPTFARIVEGIDAALAAGIPINLRVVVDRDNIDNLPDLARFAVTKGWTQNPLFKTQLGRNYELHTCRLDNTALFGRLELYQSLYHLIKKDPQFLQFHRPAYSITRFLYDNGVLPDPLFDSCPGTKTEWAFDYTGKIYACTATVGKEGESMGTFYPRITRNDAMVEQWEERDVTSISQCKTCVMQLACGGGCAAVAKNKQGSLWAPDCRPVTELMAMGMALYFNEEITNESHAEEN